MTCRVLGGTEYSQAALLTCPYWRALWPAKDRVRDVSAGLRNFQGSLQPLIKFNLAAYVKEDYHQGFPALRGEWQVIVNKRQPVTLKWRGQLEYVTHVHYRLKRTGYYFYRLWLKNGQLPGYEAPYLKAVRTCTQCLRALYLSKLRFDTCIRSIPIPVSRVQLMEALTTEYFVAALTSPCDWLFTSWPIRGLK